MEDNHNTRGQQSVVIVPVFTPEEKKQKIASLPSHLSMLSVNCHYNSKKWKTLKKNKKGMKCVVHVLLSDRALFIGD